MFQRMESSCGWRIICILPPLKSGGSGPAGNMLRDLPPTAHPTEKQEAISLRPQDLFACSFMGYKLAPSPRKYLALCGGPRKPLIIPTPKTQGRGGPSWGWGVLRVFRGLWGPRDWGRALRLLARRQAPHPHPITASLVC